MEAHQVRPEEVWCIECQTGHTPVISAGVLKAVCDWDDPVKSGMAADPTIERPSIVRAREAARAAAGTKVYTLDDVRAEIKLALGDFVAQLKAAGVQVVDVKPAMGAVAAPGSA